MKNVYDASNSLEAHMVLNLLEQAGISGRIDGEYLQGAAGELPPGRLVRVMVEESDVDDARSIIRDWDASQPAVEPRLQQKSSSGLTGFIAGCITGGGFVAWLYNSPVTVDGIDFNGDGRLDETYTYKDGRISSIEIDRNLDGKVDAISSYDLSGLVKATSSDDDFDGTMETRYRYKNNLITHMESDTNNDGVIDNSTEFIYGMPATETLTGTGNNAPIKALHWEAGILKSAEYDSDGNGVFDIRYEYDMLREIAARYYLE